METIRVIFLCRGNSCRSQMAEALANGLPRRHFRLEARSAGLTPMPISDKAVRALAELGIDASGQRSKHVKVFGGEFFDYVIPLCGEVDEDCPVLRGGRHVTISLPDPCRPRHVVPGDDEMGPFRRTRDAIRAMLTAWFGPEK